MLISYDADKKCDSCFSVDKSFYSEVAQKSSTAFIFIKMANTKQSSIIKITVKIVVYLQNIDCFTGDSSYCFQRILAIAILSLGLSVCLSVTRVDQS